MIYLIRIFSSAPSNSRNFSMSPVRSAKIDFRQVVVFNPNLSKEQFSEAIMLLFETILANVTASPSFELKNIYACVSSKILDKSTFFIIDEDLDSYSAGKFEEDFMNFINDYFNQLPKGTVITDHEIEFGFNVKTEEL